uniref:Putative secreted protein n=1 Tax=Anopheles darlingi TaxID=43151 RepID=A0A2M4DN07_ANODA
MNGQASSWFLMLSSTLCIPICSTSSVSVKLKDDDMRAEEEEEVGLVRTCWLEDFPFFPFRPPPLPPLAAASGPLFELSAAVPPLLLVLLLLPDAPFGVLAASGNGRMTGPVTEERELFVCRPGSFVAVGAMLRFNRRRLSTSALNTRRTG